MKQRILFLGLVFLTLINIVDGMLMMDLGSLIVALMLMYLSDLARVGGELGAPHAEKKENPFGFSDHQTVYIEALKRSLLRVEHARAKWRASPTATMHDEYYRKYDRAKWTYTLLYNRYEKAKRLYGWER